MKMKTTLALFAAMAAVMAVPLSADAKEFTDVASDHWYYDYVSEISDKGIMTGKDAAGTVFAPAEVFRVRSLRRFCTVWRGVRR